MIEGLLVACLALLLGVWDRRQHLTERHEWALERHSLLDRIQHPQVIQNTDPGPLEKLDPPEDAGEMAKVGSLILGEEWDGETGPNHR